MQLCWSLATKNSFKTLIRWLGNPISFGHVLTVPKWWPGSGICATKAKSPVGKAMSVDMFLERVKRTFFLKTLRKAWKRLKWTRSRVDRHPATTSCYSAPYLHSHSTETFPLMKYPESVVLCLVYLSSLSLNPDNLSAPTVSLDQQLHKSATRCTQNTSFHLFQNQVLKALLPLTLTLRDTVDNWLSQALRIAVP